jgi:hypothetical protein
VIGIAIRTVGSCILCGAVALTLAAQDPDGKKAAPVKKGEEEIKAPPRVAGPDEKPDPEQKPEAKAPVAGAQEDPQKIIERLKKNFNDTEGRLDGNDPGEQTRKLQEQIIEDLDKLLQQSQNNSGGGGGGGGASSSSGGGSSSSRGNQGKSGSSGNSGGAANNQPGNQGGGGSKNDQKKNGGANNGKGDQAKNDPKDGKGGGGGNDKKDQKNGQGGGNGKNDTTAKKPPTVEDLYKNPWGSLPQKKRQEMDAYGRDRFLQKYEQLLREYYRTIAEQDKRRDQD